MLWTEAAVNNNVFKDEIDQMLAEIFKSRMKKEVKIVEDYFA